MKSICATDRWLAYTLRNPKPELRLFCFPYAGGSALVYRPWLSRLAGTVDVCPVQLPGRGSRMQEEPFSDLLELVEVIGEALLQVMSGRFAFFGHSMGAMISFELARYLRRKNRPGPAHLFVSGRAAPQIPDPEPERRHLSDTELIKELRRLKGTPSQVLEYPELMQIMLPILRGDFSLCETYSYSPGPPFDCPITVFGGIDDEDVKREHLEPWREQTRAEFALHMLPGDHFFLHESQQILLQRLRLELGRTPVCRK